MPKIIVSYRRSDTQAIAGRIFDRLTSRYGDDSVFMDIDNIPFGIDFRTHIHDALMQSDILVAVIGPRWLGTKAEGAHRIDEETDPVRVEIETALRQRIPVVPVLVDGATMPAASELPEALKDLAFINAAPVDTGRDFRAHMDRLIRGMDGILARKAGATPVAPGAPAQAVAAETSLPVAVSSPPSRARMIWLLGPVALVLLGVGVWALLPKFSSGPPLPQTESQSAARFPEYKGRVSDEPGFLHPDTRAALAQKLDGLEAKTKAQVAVAILREVPNSSLTEFADELARRWKIGGDQRNGVLLIIYPSQRRLSLHVGAGLQDKLDRAATNLIVQDIDKRLQVGDVVGGLMSGIDNIVEVLTGDPKAWLAKMSGTPAEPAPVVHPTPPPVTYRILPNVSGGVQNLRTGPATKYPIVVAVPAGATGITISGCRNSEDGTRPWCAANWRNYSGWISSCCIVDEKTGAPPRLD